MNQTPNSSNKIYRIIAWFGSPESPHLGRLWILFFIYPALMAVFVQFVALPYIFPDWHAGGGTLIQGDTTKMHYRAVNMANEIRDQGWSAWELRPGTGTMAPIGIAASIYAVTTPALWTLIPLNAALHATAALLLLLIANTFLRDWRMAFVAVLPFWLYPSAMNWYTQLHKDGFSIAGAYMFLYGWTLLVQKRAWTKSYRRIALALIWISLGSVLTWIVRPYMFKLMLGVSAAFMLAFTIVFGIRFLKKPRKWHFALLVFAVLFASLIASQSSLPLIDEMATPFYNYRNYFVSKAGISNYDEDVLFESVGDIISYIPRATQIALVAPFPDIWFGQGNEAQTTIMRRVVGIEMVGIYISLVGMPIAIWRWRRKLEFWMAFIFSFSMAVLYSLVVANMGALYRYRYGFTMIIVALGIAGWFSLGKQRWKHR